MSWEATLQNSVRTENEGGETMRLYGYRLSRYTNKQLLDFIINGVLRDDQRREACKIISRRKQKGV